MSVERPADSRDALLWAARKIFAQKGFESATVKELAETADVNVSLVSYYFGGKEGLYRTCLQEAGSQRLAMAERLLKAPESREDFRVRLKLFAEEFISFHLEESDVTTILHRECNSESSIAQDVFKNTFLKGFGQFTQFLQVARDRGIMRPDVDIASATLVFFGGLIHTLRMSDMHVAVLGLDIKNEAFREKVIHQSIQIFLTGTLNHSAEESPQ